MRAEVERHTTEQLLCCAFKMSTPLALSSTQYLDCMIQSPQILDHAHLAELIHRYDPHSNFSRQSYGYILIHELNDWCTNSHIQKPCSIEGWTYGTKKIQGRSVRLYYRDVAQE
jgi:hypothetical protein